MTRSAYQLIVMISVEQRPYLKSQLHKEGSLRMKIKKGIFFMIFLAMTVSFAALAQTITSDKVPAPVMQVFQAKFPEVKNVEWKIKSEKYEVEFILKGVETTIKFDVHGKWLETEIQIPLSEVPKAVLDAVATRFESYKIVETQTLQLFDDSRIIYEIHLENEKEIIKALLYADGTILNQSLKPKKTEPPERE
jgi:hypothetical protein